MTNGTTINHHSMTFYLTRGRATDIARVNSEHDPDWVYEVVDHTRGFYVRIRDEDGEIVGTL